MNAVASVICVLGNIFSPLGSCQFTDVSEYDDRRCLDSHYNTYYVRSVMSDGREVMVREQYLVCDLYKSEGSTELVWN